MVWHLHVSLTFCTSVFHPILSNLRPLAFQKFPKPEEELLGSVLFLFVPHL